MLIRMITTAGFTYMLLFLSGNILKRRGKPRKLSTSAQKELSRQGLSPSKKRWQPMAPCKIFRLEHGAGWRSVVSGGFLRHLMIASWCNRCQSSWRYLQKHQVWVSGSYTLHLLVSFRYLLVFIVVLNLETLFLFSQHVLIVSTRCDSSCRLLSYSYRYRYIWYDMNGYDSMHWNQSMEWYWDTAVCDIGILWVTYYHLSILNGIL